MSDEMTYLLRDESVERPRYSSNKDDLHAQFCNLVGVPSSAATSKEPTPNHNGVQLLYQRALNKLKAQRRIYTFTAALTNTLLLSQVVLGAALTGLGASASSHILITLFGALNTVLAGLIAYIKSRGQPMRARMFRDDLDRVIDEIENSEVMFLGISRDVHGYDEIDVENEVSVRSEIARLTRLYDRAVKSSTMNNPEMYTAGGNVDPTTGLRARPAAQVPAAAPAAGAAVPAAAAPAAADDADASPATAKPKPDEPAAKAPETAEVAPKPAEQPNADESPATRADHNGSPASDDASSPKQEASQPDKKKT